MDAVHIRRDRNIKPVIDKDFRGSSRSGIPNAAHKIVESLGFQILLTDLNHFDSVPNRAMHVRQNVSVPPIRDVAADHSTVRF